MAKNFFRNNLILVASTMASGLLGYFFHFVVSRKLSVAEYGELQAVISLYLIFGFLATALSYFIIKYSSVLASHGDRGGQAGFILFLTKKFRKPVLGIFAAYLFLMPLLKAILHLKDYLGLVTIGCSVVFFISSAFYIYSLQGWKKFFAVGIIGVSAAALKLASGWALAVFFPEASIVSLSIFISAFAGWFMARSISERKWRTAGTPVAEHDWKGEYFSDENLKKSFTSILFFSLALAALSNFDIIIVKNIAASEIAGYYAALSVLGKIIMWLNFAVVAVLLPDAFSAGYAGKPVHPSSVWGSYGLILLLSLPVLLCYYLFSGLLTSLLFGQKYTVVAQNLWLFGLMALFLSLLTLEANLSLARRGYKVIYILGGTIVLLAFSIFLHHADLREIIFSVIFSFSLGWLIIFSLNLHHRFRFLRAEIFRNRKEA